MFNLLPTGNCYLLAALLQLMLLLLRLLLLPLMGISVTDQLQPRYGNFP